MSGGDARGSGFTSARNRRPRGPHHWRRRHKIWAAVALALIVLGVIVWLAQRGAGGVGSTPVEAVPVIAARVQRGAFIVYRSAPGTVKPGRSVVVRSHVQGQLEKIAFTGGERVRKGDLLAEIEARPFKTQLRLARAKLARDRALLDNAQATLKRYRALLAEDSITPQRVNDQQSLVHQYKARVQAGEARVARAKWQLSHTRITAPIGGRVGLSNVSPGNFVGPSDAEGIVVITQSRPAEVVFALPVEAVAPLKRRLQAGACVAVGAYGDGHRNLLGRGRLLAVNNRVDPATATVRMKARFPNSHGQLFPNAFVTVKLAVKKLAGAILVPSAAIQHGAAGAFVYLVKPDRTVAVVPVEPGPSNASVSVIESGVAPGAKVVIRGVGGLRAGTRVEPSLRGEPPGSKPAIPYQCAPGEAGSARVAPPGKRTDQGVGAHQGSAGD